jgi:hypothetical protein
MTYIKALICAAISVWIIDYASFGFIGFYVSYIIFAFLLIKTWLKQPEYILLYVLLFPQLPRGILDLFNGLAESRITYNNLYSIDLINGVSLFWCLILLTTIRFFRRNISVDRDIAPFLLLGSLSLITGLFRYSGISTYFISDIRFFISLLFIASINEDIIRRNEKYWDMVKLAVLTIALRVIIILILDLINEGISLDLAQSPFYILPVISSYVHSPHGLMFYLISVLAPSRAVMVWTTLMLFGLLLKSKVTDRIKYISVLFVGTVALLSFVYVSNPRLFDFLVWKSNIFSAIVGKSEFSGSGGVRGTEIVAVWREVTSNPLSMLFGKGWGSTYDLDIGSMTQKFGVIDLKSYSKMELATNRFYSVHSVIAFVLLKFGLLGIVSISLMLLGAIRKSILFALFSLPIVYSFYSIPFSLIIYLLIKKRWRIGYH